MEKISTKNDFNVKILNSDSNKTEFVYNITNQDYKNLRATCNFYNLLRRGKKQKIVSYSLYGNNLVYYSKLEKLIRQIKHFYPEWIVRIYHDNSFNKSIKCNLECLKHSNSNEYLDNLDFCNGNKIQLNFNKKNRLNTSLIFPTLLRFLPLGDSFVDVFVSRDTDSFILKREVDSIKVWFNSLKYGHIMRDHPYHNAPILAGMWGVFNSRNRALSRKLYKKLVNFQILKQLKTLGLYRKGK